MIKETNAMENLIKQLSATVKTLELADKRTVQIITSERERDISRQLKSMETLSEKFQSIKYDLLHAKFEAEEEGVDEWESLQEEIIHPFEKSIDDLQSKLDELRLLKRQEQEREERAFMQERHQIEIEEEKRKETTKAEIRRRIGDSTTTGEMDTQKVAKLPKLSITKFSGTHLDWLRFWGQFESEIDKASLAPVTKFSYLKELVIPSVRVIIDGLPFNSEGYERAKNILLAKYGQNSEIVAAHVK